MSTTKPISALPKLPSPAQGPKMKTLADTPKAKTLSDTPKWDRNHLPPGVNPALLPDAGKPKSSPTALSGKMASAKTGLSVITGGVKPKPLSSKLHKPVYPTPLKPAPLSAKVPKLVTTRQDKAAMAWAPTGCVKQTLAIKQFQCPATPTAPKVANTGGAATLPKDPG